MRSGGSSGHENRPVIFICNDYLLCQINFDPFSFRRDMRGNWVKFFWRDQAKMLCRCVVGTLDQVIINLVERKAFIVKRQADNPVGRSIIETISGCILAWRSPPGVSKGDGDFRQPSGRWNFIIRIVGVDLDRLDDA